MTSLERVQLALSHHKPDRTPRLLYEEAVGYTPAIAELLKKKCAPRSPLEYFQMDIAGVSALPSRLGPSRFAAWQPVQAFDAGQVDEWGVWWKSGSVHHFRHIESPLRAATDVRQIKEYPWPDVDELYRYEGLAEKVQSLHRRGLAVCALPPSIFEQAWYLRSFEQMLMDMLADPDIAQLLLQRTSYYQRKAAEAFTRAGVDIIITGDDVANQKSLMMSAEVWRRLLKPLQTATARAVKAINPAVKVFYHCDGNVEPLIPDLIETGIDILNPIQPECMDPARIKAQFGDRLSFWGTVSVQRTMCLGTPEEVKAEVRQRINTVGRGGGFILAPAHVLGPETPWENIQAFFEAADEG